MPIALTLSDIQGLPSSSGAAVVPSSTGAAPGPRTGGPAPLRLDEQGREVDEQGKPVERRPAAQALKVHILTLELCSLAIQCPCLPFASKHDVMSARLYVRTLILGANIQTLILGAYSP